MNDFFKGAITAAFSAPATILLQSLETGEVTIHWPMMLKVAGASFMAYIIKNWLTPSK
jgi:hypothetical protein